MELIKIQTKDKIHLAGLLSATADKESIIIHVHGLSGDFYTDFYHCAMHDYYPKNNIAFLAGENRGSHTIKLTAKGDYYEDTGSAFEIFEDCVYDIQAWIDYAESLGYKNIYLQGHSFGPTKIAYYIDQVKPKNIKGLIWISPSDMIGLVHSEDCFKEHEILLPEARKLVAEGKENQILSQTLWEFEYFSAKTYLNFFDENSNLGIFNFKNTDQSWRTINEIYLPVLAITGTQDDGISLSMDPKDAMALLETELKNSPMKITKIYENAEHDFKGYENQIVEDVVEFVKLL